MTQEGAVRRLRNEALELAIGSIAHNAAMDMTLLFATTYEAEAVGRELIAHCTVRHSDRYLVFERPVRMKEWDGVINSRAPKVTGEPKFALGVRRGSWLNDSHRHTFCLRWLGFDPFEEARR